MQILIDYNFDGDAQLLFGTLVTGGWVDLLDLEFVYFRDALLNSDVDDTTLWRFVQARGMILLTYNRNNDDETSLTATIRRENTADSLPILTIANPLRMKEAAYRQTVAEALADVLFYLENYFGAGRVFIP